MTGTEGVCIACGRSSDEVPLLALEYRRSTFHLCPRELPLLIHDPGRLAGLLPGAESMEPAEHRHPEPER